MPLAPLFKDTGYGVLLWLPTSNTTSQPPFRRSKIVENLAVVNYDTNNLYLAPYDWRLSYHNLEERDGYFSKLKSTIELFKYAPFKFSVIPHLNSYCRKRQKRKVVVAAHSMGATVS